jgi:hypothetical protein
MSAFRNMHAHLPVQLGPGRTPENPTELDPSLVHLIRFLEEQTLNHGYCESIVKDVASMLHCSSLARSAISFLSAIRSDVSRRLHMGLLTELRRLVNKEITLLNSRVIYVQIPSDMGIISLDLLSKLFPNVQKIWRIILHSSGHSCLIEFASHSSARRAVDYRQPFADTSPVRCHWVDRDVDIPILDLEKISKNFPIIEIIETIENEVIKPSGDWRRPRPGFINSPIRTPGPPSPVSESSELVSFLKFTGAFDDQFPIDNSLLRELDLFN